MLGLALMLPRTLLDAWAFWLFWRWFVLPLGAPALGYWQAMGLDLFLGLILLTSITKVEEDENTRNGLIIVKFVTVPIIVGMGWGIHQIMGAA